MRFDQTSEDWSHFIVKDVCVKAVQNRRRRSSGNGMFQEKISESYQLKSRMNREQFTRSSGLRL